MRNVCSQQNLIFPYYFPVVEAEVLNVAAMTVEVKEPYQKEATVQLEALDTLPLEVEKPDNKDNRIVHEIVQLENLDISPMEMEVEVNVNQFARIVQLEAELDKMKRENMEYKFHLEKVSEVLHPDQMKRLISPNCHWSDGMYDIAIQGYAAMHSKGYNFCREKILIPSLLPHQRSIQRKLAKVPCEPGECTAFLKMTKLKVDVMEPHQKLCILKVDEMSLKPKLEFDMTNQCYCGTITLPLGKALIRKRRKETGYYDESKELATHALSAFIGLLCGDIDQLVGFHFTGNSFCPEAVAKWLIKLVGSIREIGLKNMGICMDMGTQNIAI